MRIAVLSSTLSHIAFAIGAAAMFSDSVLAQTARKVDFAKDVQPILREHCIECHGPSQQMNGLRLDRRRDVVPNRVGANRSPVVSGNSGESRLYLRISGTTLGQQMPPSGPLSPDQISTIKTWIDSGTEWPDELAGGKSVTAGDQAVAAIGNAIREGDRRRFAHLIRERPASATARDTGGWTPLMYAAAYGETRDVRLLLGQGVDPNAQNDEGATALIYATDDLDKTRLLLDHGAKPNLRSGEGQTALLVAVSRPGSYPIVKLLLERGADAKVRLPNGWSTLQLPALQGELPVIRLLLDHGADGKGVFLGSLRAVRCPACMDLLLPSAEPGALGPVLAGAAMAGDAALFQKLLDLGAKPPPLALHFVAISPEPIPKETIHRLISLSPNVRSAAPSGLTVRELARRHNNVNLLEALAEAGITEDDPPRTPLQPKPADSVGAALDRSIAALQRADVAFLQKAGCVSCHNNSLTAMSAAAVRAKGVRIDERVAKDQAGRIASFLDENRERAFEGIGLPGAIDTASYILLGLAAAGYPSDAITDAWAKYVKALQAPDGSWPCITRRPPLESSDFQTTAASIRALQTYGGRSRRAEYDKAVARATAWLQKAQPKTVEDLSFQILGLVWGGGNRRVIRSAAQSLLALQEPDGGWAQRRGAETEAYSTGQALFSLRTAGAVARANGAFQRGIQYLMRSQLADGSWYVASRSVPFQPYFDSDFPHGPDQFISAAATSWASMALASALP
jgi:ankyrin repeat protein/mono/diheme cytochrome c family protein